ncbi:MAG: hypothetical protein LC792_17660 [Actinobacteria bacterium]|nr:hypothetical protein [Actinomycetota bacterium]
MALQTRRPTGKPPWPITLIAGIEKAGKSYAAAQASASPLIGRTFWFTMGEDDPDEYGAIEGARFEIVQYDGTFRGLHGSMREALQEPNDPERPNLFVEDSASRLWAMLSDEAQEKANHRWARRRANAGKNPPEDGAVIGTDLWNNATGRWNAIMNLLRQHQGPSIITARLAYKSLMVNGEPSGEKEWKVEGQKGLPFDVGTVIQLHARGEAYLTGVRSMRFQPTEALTPYPDFTMHDLWTKLGLADAPAGARTHTAASGAESLAADALIIAQRGEILEQIKEACKIARVSAETVAVRWMNQHHHPIQETTDLGSLAIVLADLQEYIESKQQQQAQEAQVA